MPVEIFFSYSHKRDEALRAQLEVHLSQLVRDGLIRPWSDRQIAGGDNWSTLIDQHVRSAQIILLLVSPDFLASDYCYGVEMKLALERHVSERAVVIPIILRPADWHSAPFAGLQALPRDGRAVTLWKNRDEAFAQIAQSIRKIVVDFDKPDPSQGNPPLLDNEQTPSARVVDAAMPSHVARNRATELLVLVRLPGSKGLAGIVEEDDETELRPEDVRSKPFEVTFPRGPTGSPQPLKIIVRVTAPDFEPPSQSKNIMVEVDRDSPVCPFLLTPVRTGFLIVAIELIWEDTERGYRRLKTNCVAEAEPLGDHEPTMVLAQMQIGAANAPSTSSSVEVRAAPGFKSHAALYGKVGLLVCLFAVGATLYVTQPSAQVQSIEQPSIGQPTIERQSPVPRSAIPGPEGKTEFPKVRPPLSPDHRKEIASPSPPASVPKRSVALEERLASVEAKVQNVRQTIEALRRQVGREGSALDSDTLTRFNHMNDSLNQAKLAIAVGNAQEANKHLDDAEALVASLRDLSHR